MSSLMKTEREVMKPELFPLWPSFLTFGATTLRFGTDGEVGSDGLEEVLTPLEDCCRTNYYSVVELEELDSSDDMDTKNMLAQTIGTKKNVKRRKRNRDLNLTYAFARKREGGRKLKTRKNSEEHLSFSGQIQTKCGGTGVKIPGKGSQT